MRLVGVEKKEKESERARARARERASEKKKNKEVEVEERTRRSRSLVIFSRVPFFELGKKKKKGKTLSLSPRLTAPLRSLHPLCAALHAPLHLSEQPERRFEGRQGPRRGAQQKGEPERERKKKPVFSLSFFNPSKQCANAGPSSPRRGKKARAACLD